MTLTDKWQCSKCKILKVYTAIIDSETNRPTDESRAEIKHCHRLMRNLSETVYIKEKSIKDSGIRG